MVTIKEPLGLTKCVHIFANSQYLAHEMNIVVHITLNTIFIVTYLLLLSNDVEVL